MSTILASKRRNITIVGKYQRQIERVPLVLVATTLFAVALVVWHYRDRLSHVEVVALDLRSDVTRSSDTSFKVPHKKTRLMIKLPLGSAEGIYEVDLLKGEPASSVLHGTGRTQVRTDGEVHVEIELNFARVTSGHYLLSVWHGNANPQYQPVLVE